jgi:dihydrofolate reductase
MQESPDVDVRLVREDAIKQVRQLKQRPGKDIWLCGGANLASELFAEIDELILKVNPFLLGKGIPLFGEGIPTTSLELMNHRVYDNGFMLVHFRLVH